MPNNNSSINLFDTYTMTALVEEVTPVPSFFKDRFFRTGEEDIFSTQKVLIEVADGDAQMAPIVARSVGDIPVERGGYTVHELAPAYVGVSRPLTADDLEQRGFGEALFTGTDPAKRAARLMLRDFARLDARITRREEWLAVQTMMNNACEMQEYVDANTMGDKAFLCYYEDKNEHKYILGEAWTMNTSAKVIFDDIIAMCEKLTDRGLPAEDLVIGANIASIFRHHSEISKMLEKTSGVIVGEINETRYPGATRMGVLNFGGHELTIWNVNESYMDAEKVLHKYFPVNGIMVSAPNCGCMKYGAITQKEHGAAPEAWFTRTGKRIPKLKVDVNNDAQSLRLACKPLPVPRNRTPWIFAVNE